MLKYGQFAIVSLSFMGIGMYAVPAMATTKKAQVARIIIFLSYRAAISFIF